MNPPWILKAFEVCQSIVSCCIAVKSASTSLDTRNNLCWCLNNNISNGTNKMRTEYSKGLSSTMLSFFRLCCLQTILEQLMTLSVSKAVCITIKIL